MSNLSTIERLHQGQTEESRLSQILRQERGRARRRAEASALASSEEEARALPTELFETNPALVRLTTAAANARQRAERVSAGAWRSNLEMLGGGVAEELLEAERELLAAAIDDVLDGDAGFPRSLDALSKVDSCRDRAEAFNLAAGFLGKSRTALIDTVWSDVRRYEAERIELLLQLKRDHMKACAGE